MPDRITRARVIRLLVHLPAIDGGPAAVSFTVVKTTRGIPHAQTMMTARLKSAAENPADPVALAYCRQALDELLKQVQR
jgi:hypothetical protein